MNNLIPPPKDLGVFLTALEVEGDSLTGLASKVQVKSSKGCTGIHGVEDSRSTKFKGYLKFGGVFT